MAHTLSIAAAALVLAGAGGSGALAAGDPVHGKAVFDQCTGCHVLSGPGFAAPALGGVVGRKAGTAPGFQYSDALTKSGIVWSEQSLDNFLTDPAKLVPGTTMYVGLDSAKDRADVIAYLKTVAGAPSP
jgi:cytochrome c2